MPVYKTKTGSTIGLSDKDAARATKEGRIKDGVYLATSKSTLNSAKNKADSEKRQSYLDPNATPEGWSRNPLSSNNITKTEFRPTEFGNIERVDYDNMGREGITFIPNTQGFYRAEGDQEVGDVYGRQNSATGFTNIFRRGDKMGTAPPKYVQGQREASLESMMSQARKSIQSPMQTTVSAAPGGVSRVATGTATGAQPEMNWQQRLQWIQTNPNSPDVQQWVNNEIARAGQVWQQKTAAGDTAGAEAAHQWANQLRGVMGLQAGVDYDPRTGSSLNAGMSAGSLTSETTAQGAPWWQNFTQEVPLYQDDIPYQSEMQSIMEQLQKKVNEPFSYNPETDPQYNALVNSATQTVMENMNARGILSSTVTRDQVAQAIAPIISQLMQQAYTRHQGNISNLMDLFSRAQSMENTAYQRRQQAEETAYTRQRQAQLDQLAAEKQALEVAKAEIKNALDRVKTIGYVDNAASVVLGIPVGTLSWEAQKFAQQELNKLEMKQMEIDGAMQRVQVQQAGAMSRTQYTQGQINARQNNDMTEQEINNLALQMAKADSRLADEYNAPDGANYFTLNQLIDAYKRQLTGDTDESEGGEDIQSLIEQARANGYSDAEIADSLRGDGIDPSEYGL